MDQSAESPSRIPAATPLRLPATPQTSPTKSLRKSAFPAKYSENHRTRWKDLPPAVRALFPAKGVRASTQLPLQKRQAPRSRQRSVRGQTPKLARQEAARQSSPPKKYLMP